MERIPVILWSWREKSKKKELKVDFKRIVFLYNLQSRSKTIKDLILVVCGDYLADSLEFRIILEGFFQFCISSCLRLNFLVNGIKWRSMFSATFVVLCLHLPFIHYVFRNEIILWFTLAFWSCVLFSYLLLYNVKRNHFLRLLVFIFLPFHLQISQTL